MPNPKNVIGKGNRFSSTNQPKNSGRKPKLYRIAASGYKVSKEEFSETANYVMQLPKEEAMRLADKADTPIWVVLVIRVTNWKLFATACFEPFIYGGSFRWHPAAQRIRFAPMR